MTLSITTRLMGWKGMAARLTAPSPSCQSPSLRSPLIPSLSNVTSVGPAPLPPHAHARGLSLSLPRLSLSVSLPLSIPAIELDRRHAENLGGYAVLLMTLCGRGGDVAALIQRADDCFRIACHEAPGTIRSSLSLGHLHAKSPSSSSAAWPSILLLVLSASVLPPPQRPYSKRACPVEVHLSHSRETDVDGGLVQSA